jgi:hypothetical protein
VGCIHRSCGRQKLAKNPRDCVFLGKFNFKVSSSPEKNSNGKLLPSSPERVEISLPNESLNQSSNIDNENNVNEDISPEFLSTDHSGQDLAASSIVVENKLELVSAEHRNEIDVPSTPLTSQNHVKEKIQQNEEPHIFSLDPTLDVTSLYEVNALFKQNEVLHILHVSLLILIYY